jgi:serine/threonine-protein kinase
MDATGAAARPSRLLRLAKYDVLEEIGHGGMATVYRAHDPRLARDVAIKVIHPHLRDSPEVAHRFAVEAKAVAKLRHANIVEVYDVSGEDEDEQYLVVELLRGLTLRKLLQKHGALPPEVAAAFALDLLAALAHAHAAGVIHRDVKPENVIVEHRADANAGEKVAVKLTDFGIAKLLDAQGVTSTGQVLGSPAHMAPEQIEGGDVDVRADVFGLGVLLYEAMVGHLPFEGANPAQVLRRVLDGSYPNAEQERGTIGKRWSVILDRALAHDANDRYADANAMREAIAEELSRAGIDKPRDELDAWLADPKAYEKEHAKKTIDRLVSSGAEARKRGDALSAAADYNRALAYAPNDPALLKVVATMHRADALARTLKRVGRVAGVMVALGAGAFFVTRAVRSTILPDPALTPIQTAKIDLSAMLPEPSAAPSIVTTTSAPSAVASVPHLVAPIKSAGLPKETKRDVILSVGFPQFGVLARLDGDADVDVSGSYTFTTTSTAHVLHLSCKEDLCIPRDLTVAAGEENVPVNQSLTIRPATLTVHGDANAIYQISGTLLAPRAEVPIQVPMKGKSARFTIKQLPSGAEQTIELVAGKAGEVTFAR